MYSMRKVDCLGVLQPSSDGLKLFDKEGGVLIFKANYYIYYMLTKIGKNTSFLNRYKSIIAARFEYCATLIINMGETRLGMLQKVQNERFTAL